jgi:hypothetical protein
MQQQEGYNLATIETEQIQKLNDKIEALKAQKRAVENRARQKAEKEKTRRLVECGKLVEKHLSFDTLEQLEELLKNFTTLAPPAPSPPSPQPSAEKEEWYAKIKRSFEPS